MEPRRVPLDRVFVALVVACAASPIVLHALWRPIGTATGAFAAVPAPLLSVVAVVVPVLCAVLFAAASHRPAGDRAVLAAAVALAAAAAAVLGAPRGAVLPLVPPLAAVAFIAGAGLPWLARRLPGWLDGAAKRRRATAALWAVLGLAVVTQAARVSTFMADPERTGASLLPVNEFFLRHACLTAYLNAAELTRRGVGNVYDAALVPEDETDPDQRAVLDIGAFRLDPYEYPPPFLLLPRLALALTNDFFVLRAVWFAIQAGLLAFALIRLARWVGGEAGRRAALLAPLVWVSFAAFIGLQFGNFHIGALAMSVLAMLAFEERRPALGGALLAFVVLAKLSPGLLVVFLLAQRRYRDVAWVAAFGALWTLAALAVVGPGPFVAFVTYHLPRLSSGAAFGFIGKTVRTVIGNFSIFGVPFKLRELGVPGMSWGVASGLAWVYTLVALGLAVIAARRTESRRLQACAWLAVLSLGALRSPYAPLYVVLSTLWLLTLLAAEVRGRRAVAAFVACWIVVSTLLPLPNERVAIALSLVTQAAGVALVVWVVLRRPRLTDDERAAPA